MSPKVEKQAGWILERVEVADDHVYEWTQDHDEGKQFALDVPAGRRRHSELGPLLARRTLENHVTDMSDAAFALPRKPVPAIGHAGVVILVSVLRQSARIALLQQKLMHVLAQMVRNEDAHVGIPRRSAGKLHPGVYPQLVLTVGMSLHLIV
jgi:hypothetical protein